jgi:hypothetical protein
MATRKMTEMKCDQCGKVTTQTDGTYGGNPFHGWVSAKRQGGVPRDIVPYAGEWDFCSDECASKFFSSNAVLRGDCPGKDK